MGVSHSKSPPHCPGGVVVVVVIIVVVVCGGGTMIFPRAVAQACMSAAIVAIGACPHAPARASARAVAASCLALQGPKEPGFAMSVARHFTSVAAPFPSARRLSALHWPLPGTSATNVSTQVSTAGCRASLAPTHGTPALT